MQEPTDPVLLLAEVLAYILLTVLAVVDGLVAYLLSTA